MVSVLSDRIEVGSHKSLCLVRDELYTGSRMLTFNPRWEDLWILSVVLRNDTSSRTDDLGGLSTVHVLI